MSNQLDDKDPTDLLLLEIEHWKKFRTLFEGIPELHFTYFLNHWNTNIIDEFFEDYPDLYNLPNNVIDNMGSIALIIWLKYVAIQNYQKYVILANPRG